MNDEISKFAEQQRTYADGGMVSQPRRFTLTERLEAERQTLKDRLAQIEKLLEALGKQPQFQELFDLISKHL
jgi:hypothetical protein